MKRDSRIWNRPINDSMNLVRVHADPLRRNNQTEKRDRLGMKQTSGSQVNVAKLGGHAARVPGVKVRR